MGYIAEASCEIVRLVSTVLSFLTESNLDCQEFGANTRWPFYVHSKVRRQIEKDVRRDELEKIFRKLESVLTVDPYQGKRLFFIKSHGSNEPIYSLRFSKYRCLYMVRKTGENKGHSLILSIDIRSDVYSASKLSVPPCP